MPKPLKTADPKTVLAALMRYCAYQERCYKEIEAKLGEYDLDNEEVAWVTERLRAENYLNEERFARTYAGSKFRMLKWGRNKIKLALAQKGIPKNLAALAMKEIDADAYYNTLQELLIKKAALVKAAPLQKRKKLIVYLLTKGYEQDLVNQALQEAGL